MNIIQYDADLQQPSFQERVNRFLDFLWSTHWDDDEWYLKGWGLRLAVCDGKDSAVIQAEMPGVRKEDVRVDIRGSVLTLQGRREKASEAEADEFSTQKPFAGSFQRSITLPAAVDPRTVEANFSHGILKIIIPKPKVRNIKKIPID